MELNINIVVLTMPFAICRPIWYIFSSVMSYTLFSTFASGCAEMESYSKYQLLLVGNLDNQIPNTDDIKTNCRTRYGEVLPTMSCFV